MDHDCYLAERFGALLFDEKTSDMTLIVEGERLHVHRLILTASCEYFRALLRGNMKESFQNEVVLRDVPLRGFKLVIGYFYTGQMSLKGVEDETVFEVLEIAHLYGLTTLQTLLSQHLRKNLSDQNFGSIYAKADFLQLKELCEACHRLMLEEPSAILESETFCDLPEAVLCDTLSEDSFCANEIGIFEAILRWLAKRPPGEDRSKVLKVVRLPLFETAELLTTVKDSGLISTDLLLEALQTKACRHESIIFRGFVKKTVNLASPDRGTKELRVNVKGDVQIPGSGFVFQSRVLRCPLIVHRCEGLIIILEKPYFINSIKLETESLFEDGCHGFVEASMNLVNWVPVGEFKMGPPVAFMFFELTKSFSFRPRSVRFIKIYIARAADVRLSSLEVYLN